MKWQLLPAPRTAQDYNQHAMKKRFLYVILFALPGLLLAGLFSLFVFGASVGALWLFVFGDDPWPSAANTVLVIMLALIFLLTWAGVLWLGYIVGKRLEGDPSLNRNHILLSLGLTLLLILFIVFQQWSVGNLGPKSDDLLCRDYCVAQGYAGSGMPLRDSGDRTCSCYDSGGKEAIRIQLDEIEAK